MPQAIRPWAGTSVVLHDCSLPRAARGHVSGEVDRVDITIANGIVAAITSTQSPGPGAVDCDGGLVLPALVDVHTHLDKAQIATRTANPDGSFAGALGAVAADRAAHWTAADLRRRMDFALRSAYAHGTAAIRTHLDSDPAQRDISWTTFEAVRQDWLGRLQVQAVALIGPDQMCDAAFVRDTARWAARFGGVLGGAMGRHDGAKAAMANMVEAAAEFDLALDLHLDETLDPAAGTLRALAEVVLERGHQGVVQAGHCCSLAAQDSAEAHGTIDVVVAAGISIVTLPMCNLYLQDRQAAQQPRTPRLRGVTLVKELKAAGARVSAASDNTRDPFFAYGDMDMLEVFRELTRICQIDHPAQDAWDWLRSISAQPAAVAGFAHTGLVEVGLPADVIVLRARSWGELQARSPYERTVVRGGAAIEASLPDYRELDDLAGVLR
ncbi:cytosine deaminase [Devosia sp. PTR5]|uniref:Cytosine deaminase n=1 Tax=Devosia oryzisoli TaxID=2774138 RepID=A0A927FTJ6_9HYPH|nr:cytosine deaminase [Devosia oryzisoli]MBD8065127.1 cytosine deaminase [Devosia oryzisoli]